MGLEEQAGPSQSLLGFFIVVTVVQSWISDCGFALAGLNEPM